MKVTGAMEKKKSRTTPKKGTVLYAVTDNCSLLIFSDDSSLVVCSASVLVTTGSKRRYLKPNQVAQVAQLLQDGTSICAVARRFAVPLSTVSGAWRRYQETGRYKGELDRAMSTARALQNDLQQATGVNVSDQTVRNRLHEGGMRARHSLVGPVLTAQPRAARLEFAIEHQHWQVHH